MKSLFIAINLFSMGVHANEIINAVPGKSLGQVSIGESSAKLEKIGFKLDTSRASDPSVTYWIRGKHLARLKSDKVVEIWLNDVTSKTLTINKKRLPKKLNFQSLKKVLSNCEEHEGSGGQLVYCEGRGVEFSFSRRDGSIGFSVLLPSEADAVLTTQPQKEKQKSPF